MTQPQTEHVSSSVFAEIIVNVPQAFAFETFVKQTTWWPIATHHIGSTPAVEVIMEPQSGGRWFERDAQGKECEWGDVLIYDPTSRIVLGWHLNSNWEFQADFVTEVEILFIVEGPERTRVTLEHQNLERYGADAQKVKDSIGSEQGWPALLQMFADQAGKG